ncbi:hypothetical protein N9L19_01335 [bacterium]|nr:hypothetical protein [bacterium]
MYVGRLEQHIRESHGLTCARDKRSGRRAMNHEGKIESHNERQRQERKQPSEERRGTREERRGKRDGRLV